MIAVAQDATCQSITYRAARIVSNTGNSTACGSERY